MKKTLLTLCIAGSSFLSYSQFTPGNLVVAKTTGTTGGPAVSLVEYTQSGDLVGTFNFPTTGAGRLTLVSTTGGSTFECFLKLSTDLSKLSLAGYDANVGTTSISGTASATIKRVAVTVDKDKAVTMNQTTGFDKKYMRSVVVDGTNAWAFGNTWNATLLDLNAAASQLGTSVSISQTYVSSGIFNNKLYATYKNELREFPDLPVTADAAFDPPKIITISNVTELGANSNATDFVMFDTDDDNQADLAYIGSDFSELTAGNLEKFKLESGVWVSKGAVGAPLTLTSHNRKVQGVTGYKNADGKYVIFYSTFSSVLSFVDEAAPGANLEILGTPATETEPAIPGVPTIIATAPSGSIFRGLAFTPGSTPTVLPIQLKSFNGKAEGDRIRLDWSTASEKNNSRFEILRSTTGAPSEVIGTVQGSGNSDVSKAYSFVDVNPVAGVNYYQLNQVDASGDSHKSNVIQVKSGVKATGLTVSKGKGENIVANIYSEKNVSGRLYVSDMSGRNINEVNVSLQKGYNNISVSTLGFKTGVYIVILNTAGESLSVKFVK